jgi:response regulator RpfG family c-di-GMP phosphodiesterase
MPRHSGFDLLERLTAIEPRINDMPFLYLTALSDRANELRGCQLGADYYITKPVDFEDVKLDIAGDRLAEDFRLTHHEKTFRRHERRADAQNTLSQYSGSSPNRLPKATSNLDENPCRIDQVYGNLEREVFRHCGSRLMHTRRPVG